MSRTLRNFNSCKSCQDSIKSKSKEFWASRIVRANILRRASQKKWNTDLLSKLSEYHLRKGKVGGRKFVDRPNFHGVSFCWTTCFPILHACRYDKMNQLRKQVEAGVDDWTHEGKGKRGHRKAKGVFAVQWIQKLQDNFGESQPTDTKKIELPPDTKANLFVSYLLEMEEKSNPKVSFHHFLKIWSEDFPRLILPKNCRLVSVITNLPSDIYLRLNVRSVENAMKF